MTVQEALERLRDVAGPRLNDIMPDEISVAYSGTADRLENAFATMQNNLGRTAHSSFGLTMTMSPSVLRS
jgi:hypothetical protein